MSTPEKNSRPRKETSFSVTARRLLQKASAVRPFGAFQGESIMQFAPLGRLVCVCVARLEDVTGENRREVCRLCGGRAAAIDPDLLERTVSAAEIRALVESLRIAGVRARGLEIPPTVSSLQELQRFLEEYRGKKGRKPPRRPNAPVALSRATSR